MKYLLPDAKQPTIIQPQLANNKLHNLLLLLIRDLLLDF
jgi:hypothetical protein